jgi:hypothetical protein
MERAFRLVQISPLPKGLISDKSVNAAGDCMVSPTAYYGPQTALLVGMSVKGKRSRALARHLEWGETREADGVDWIVAGRFVSK